MTNPLSSILHTKRKFAIPILSSSSSASETTSSSEMGHSDRVDTISICDNINTISTSKSYKLVQVISGHVGGVSCLALCGEFVLSASQAKDINVWQQPDLRHFARFGSGEGSVKALVTVGNKVFTAHQDNTIRVWKISRKSENVFRLSDTLPTTKDYLGNFMKQRNYVQIRRHHKKLWIQHVDSISCLGVENGLIYSGSWDKTLKVWRLSDLRCLDSIKAHDDAINGLVVRNGRVFTASTDGKIKVWENEGSNGRSRSSLGLKLGGVLEGHKDVSINALVLSDEGGNGNGNGNDRVYGGGSDGYLMRWERREETEIGTEEWKLVVEMKAHERAILCLSEMGDILCTGSADKSICLWKRNDEIKEGGLRGMNKMGVIRGPEGPIKCLQVSPNCVGGGFLLYSGSLDKSLRVWWVPKDIDDESTRECVV